MSAHINGCITSFRNSRSGRLAATGGISNAGAQHKHNTCQQLLVLVEDRRHTQMQLMMMLSKVGHLAAVAGWGGRLLEGCCASAAWLKVDRR